MIENFFPTPVYRTTLSATLLQAILQFVKTAKLNPSQKGNSTRGGFQSDETLLAINDPAILSLKKAIYECASEYFPEYFTAHTRQEYLGQQHEFDLWGWLTMFAGGGFNAPHIHPRSTISGVYYVQTPAQVLKNANGDFAGWLGIIDPRANSQIWPLAGHINHCFIPPDPGSIVLFPSYMSHFVPPFESTDQRIAIAFNLRHKVLN